MGWRSESIVRYHANRIPSDAHDFNEATIEQIQKIHDVLTPYLNRIHRENRILIHGVQPIDMNIFKRNFLDTERCTFHKSLACRKANRTAGIKDFFFPCGFLQIGESGYRFLRLSEELIKAGNALCASCGIV